MADEKHLNQRNEGTDLGKNFDPVEFHRIHINNLPDGTVVISSFPGAGAALLGNILLELGLKYVDPYTEEIRLSGESVPIQDRINYRARLAATYREDQQGVHIISGQTIYCKTHLYSHEFAKLNLGGIIILVRDPRDTIYSYYNWRLGFSEEGEHGTFLEFLQRKSILGFYPVDDWVGFYNSWIEESKGKARVSIVRFEDIKIAPVSSIFKLLDTMNITRTNSEIKRAVEQSSFSRMRQHEDQVSMVDPGANPQKRIMRRGKINEWIEWYDEKFLPFFDTPDLLALTSYFGYKL